MSEPAESVKAIFNTAPGMSVTGRQRYFVLHAMSASHSMYVEECIRRRQAPSALFESPGFVLDYISLDSMHCGDLGVFQDAIGGLFFFEMANKDWHRSYAAGIEYLNEELRQYYRAHPGLSQIHLTVNMVKERLGVTPP